MPNRKLLSAQVGAFLKESHLFLVTAESCTGGLLGDLITNIAGSSDYYLGGLIAYSNQAKEHLLGVSPEILTKFGAVSGETVGEMAVGARKAFEGIQERTRIIGIAISGIAGPGGGSPEKPVGTVWIGISGEKGARAERFFFTGDREEIKAQSAEQALKMLMDFLSD